MTADGSLPMTPEERQRARDRSRITASRAAGRSWRLLWLLAGPGVLVMLGENDGPSMVSYATTGASYGVGFFVPFILVTFVMAYVIQEMTVRLGIATGRGHAELIFQRFGPFWGYFAMGDLVFGNVLTLVTEFIAIQAGGLYFGVPNWLSVVLGIGMVIGSLLLRRYATWERLLMGLAAFNLLFIPAALMAHPNGRALAHALAHWGPLPGGFNTAFVTLVLANIGATVTPWMIFFQQSAVVDKGLTPRRPAPGPDGYRHRRSGRRNGCHRNRRLRRAPFCPSCRRVELRERRGFRDRPPPLYRHHRRHALRPRHRRSRPRRGHDDLHQFLLCARRNAVRPA